MTERRSFLKQIMGGGSAAAAFPIVKSIEKLEMKPEDTLIVTVERPVSQQTLCELFELFKKNLPGRKVLIVTDELSLHVLKG
jgi:hypothetical protein